MSCSTAPSRKDVHAWGLSKDGLLRTGEPLKSFLDAEKEGFVCFQKLELPELLKTCAKPKGKE